MSTITVRWKYEKNGQAYCDVEVTLEGTLSLNGKEVPAAGVEAVLAKAGRIMSDPNGAKTKGVDACTRTAKATIKGLFDGTRGSGGFGEALDPVFRILRDMECKRAGLTKGYAKFLPDEDSLREHMGAEAFEAAYKALTDAGIGQ